MSVFSSLQVGSLLSYAIAIVLPALDAIFPVVPSETAVIALGVATAGSADPRIALLVACAAAGAFLGDNLSYFIGCRFSPWAERRFFAGEKGDAGRAWAERSLRRFGMQLIIVCRFIPGGRTAVTLTCGLIGYDRRKFVTATAVAAVIWALYAFFIGRLGGKAFEDKPWAGFLAAFGGTVVISVLIEVARRIRSWRGRNDMASIHGEILIARPVDEVFDYVADQSNEPHYNPQMVRAEKITPGPVGKGTRFCSAVKSAGRTAEMLIECTGYDRPTLYATMTSMAQADISYTLRFEPDAAGTRMLWSGHVRPKGAFRLLGPVISRLGVRQENRTWMSLKKHLEGPPHE